MLVKFTPISFIFSSFFFLSINCQGNGTEGNTTNPANTTNGTTPEINQTQMIMQYKDICMPTPIGIDLLSPLQPNCSKLINYPTEDAQFYCCELDFQEKKNKSAPRRRGCMAVLTNYVDNDRYEDMIDYIERGKLDQIQTYSIFLGKTAAMGFTDFIKNKTKYNVYKFDCFSGYYKTNIFMIFTLFFLLYGVI